MWSRYIHKLLSVTFASEMFVKVWMLISFVSYNFWHWNSDWNKLSPNVQISNPVCTRSPWFSVNLVLSYTTFLLLFNYWPCRTAEWVVQLKWNYVSTSNNSQSADFSLGIMKARNFIHTRAYTQTDIHTYITRNELFIHFVTRLIDWNKNIKVNW